MNKNADSVLDRLKNESKKQKVSLQQMLTLFCQEEFTRRLSNSRFKGNLILKGGFFLYTVSEFATRPTTDSDYLLKGYPNEREQVEKMLKDIISNGDKDTPIDIEIKNLEVMHDLREYPGIRARLIGKIGRTITPFSIDFGVGDSIVPAPIERTLPVLLKDFSRPCVYTYSFESVIAEKFDAIISFMELTGRMKDFFDIYYLASNFEFEGVKLQNAIYETLSKRGRAYEKTTIKHILSLSENEEIRKRWNNFCGSVLNYPLDFTKVIELIVEFIEPPFACIVIESELLKKWCFDELKYI